LAKPNYQYEKRQKDLAKKRKKEEKRLRKLGKTDAQPGEAAPETGAESPAEPQGGTPASQP
jgi:hypothetical protein